jgi:hypothetical protein
MISAMINLETKIRPTLISSSRARKLNGIKLIRGQNTKMQIFEQVRALKVIPESTWVYKRTGNPKDYVFDMVDAFVVATAGFRELSSKKT